MEYTKKRTPSAPGIAPGASAPALSLAAYRAFYASTPQAFDLKAKHLPQEGTSAVVIVDALRATTSWVAMGAAGAEAIQIFVKDYSAMDSNQSAVMADDQWLIGGEKDGKPMPGGVIGNSPTEAVPDLLSGKSIRFASTNGARAVKAAAQYTGHIYLACMTNIKATCAAILAKGYDQIVFVAGGFYGAATLEDTVAVGRMITHLIDLGTMSLRDLDDEARMSAAVADAYRNDQHLVASLKDAQVGRLLGQIGRESDVDAVVTGKGIDASVWDKMQNVVLQYRACDDVFTPAVNVGKGPNLPDQAFQHEMGGLLYVGLL